MPQYDANLFFLDNVFRVLSNFIRSVQRIKFQVLFPTEKSQKHSIQTYL